MKSPKKSTLDVAAMRAPMQETHDSGVNLKHEADVLCNE
jgi:hypothetical protein